MKSSRDPTLLVARILDVSWTEPEPMITFRLQHDGLGWEGHRPELLSGKYGLWIIQMRPTLRRPFYLLTRALHANLEEIENT